MPTFRRLTPSRRFALATIVLVGGIYEVVPWKLTAQEAHGRAEAVAAPVPTPADSEKPQRPGPPAENRPSEKTINDLIDKFSGAESFWQQEEVARKLVALGDKRVIPKIEQHLETADRCRRCNAGLVLAGLGDERGLAVIIRELEDQEPRPTTLEKSDGKPFPEGQVRQDRYYAALLLGKLRRKAVVPALIKATQDKTINYQAAISLGEIGDKSAIPALRKMAKDFPAQRLWAGYGLAAMGDREGFDHLAKVALSDSNWSDRRHAVEALGTIGDPGSVPIVVRALKDKHPNVKVSAARALGKIGDSSALPALAEALNDSSATEFHAPTTVDSEARKAIETIKLKR